MLLYKDADVFKEIVEAVAYECKIDVSYVCKDYFVMLLLKDISNEIPDIIFKGGTSLSKAWHAINRFSEDIDLTFRDRPTKGNRKKVWIQIQDIIKRKELEISNIDEVTVPGAERRDHNKYEVSYPKLNDNKIREKKVLNDDVLIETSYYIDSFPKDKREVSTYIYEYLNKTGRTDLIEKYELEPFEVNVQSLERTFIDKVFALCDYNIGNNINHKSRHIYDLYKLYPLIKIDNEFKKLVRTVRELRKENARCYSADEKVNINDELNNIKNSGKFREDYNSNTRYMLMENEHVSYEDAITVIDKIIESNLFIEKESIRDMIKDAKEKSEKQVIKNVIKNKDLML